MRPPIAPQGSMQMRPGMQRPPTRNFSPSPQTTVVRRQGEGPQQRGGPLQRKPSAMGATPVVNSKKDWMIIKSKIYQSEHEGPYYN